MLRGGEGRPHGQNWQSALWAAVRPDAVVCQFWPYGRPSPPLNIVASPSNERSATGYAAFPHPLSTSEHHSPSTTLRAVSACIAARQEHVAIAVYQEAVATELEVVQKVARGALPGEVAVRLAKTDDRDEQAE